MKMIQNWQSNTEAVSTMKTTQPSNASEDKNVLIRHLKADREATIQTSVGRELP